MAHIDLKELCKKTPVEITFHTYEDEPLEMYLRFSDDTCVEIFPVYDWNRGICSLSISNETKKNFEEFVELFKEE